MPGLPVKTFRHFLSDAVFFVRRCTPAVVLDRIFRRCKRIRIKLIAYLCRLRLARLALQRVFLTESVYLLDFEQNRPLGFSDCVQEATPAAVVLSESRFPRFYRELSKPLRSDPFGFADGASAQGRNLAAGGLRLDAGPEPAIVYTPPRRYHCTLHDGFLHAVRGGVCTRNGTMVLDSTPLPDGKSGFESMWLFGGGRPKSARYQPGCCVSLAGKWMASNYFHWLVDGLTGLRRLIEIAAGRPVTVLVPGMLPPEWMAALDICLPPGIETRRVDGWVQMEQLLFPSPNRIASFAWLSQSESGSVREAVFAHFGLDPATRGSRRIYVCRSGALTRRLTNEAEIGALLADHGFERVRLEELSFEEQVRLFHGAECVAGVHGAGFANVLFANRCRVLEFFPAGGFKPLYFGLAASLGHSYEFVHGGRPSPLMDFRLDPAALRERLAQLP